MKMSGRRRRLKSGTRRFTQDDEFKVAGIFAKVEFVRVCVEYVYDFGYGRTWSCISGIG